MSVLKIIAIVGILLGAVSFVIERRQNSKASKAIFITLVIMSVLLLLVAGKAESVFKDHANTQSPAIEAGNTEVQNDNEFDLRDEPEPAKAETPAPEAAAAPEIAEAPEAAAAPEIAEAPEAASDDDNNEFDLRDDADTDEPAKPAEPAKAEAPAPEVAAAPAAPQPAANNDALAPIADAGKNIDDGKINEVIAFSAKKSKKNPKGSNITTYAWNFGDGATADTAEAKHAYPQVGSYTATLTVTDEDGRSATAVRKIEVNRPESKIKFITKKLEDLSEITSSPEPFTGTTTKTFTGSHMNLEASGFMLASEGCTCEIALSLRGPGCAVNKSKVLKDGGEGNLTVKASCKGEPGEVTWSVSRKITGSCACTFSNVTVDGFEG